MAIEELRILAILGWGVALIFCMGFFAMWFLARESLELAGVILANYRNLVNSLPAKLRATEWRPFEYATVGIVPSAAPVVTEPDKHDEFYSEICANCGKQNIDHFVDGKELHCYIPSRYPQFKAGVPDAVVSQPEPDSWQVGFRNLADITGEAFCELSAIVGFAMEPHLHDWTGLIAKVREAVSQPEGTREFADTAEMDRHYICEIGRLFWGNNKDCYAASAVYRKVKSSLASPTPVVSGQAVDMYVRSIAAPPSLPKARETELWREIVERVTNDAIRLAILRHDLRGDPDGDGIEEDEIVTDIVGCLTGDDIGCGMEEDTDDPAKCAGAFVRQKLAGQISQTKETQWTPNRQ